MAKAQVEQAFQYDDFGQHAASQSRQLTPNPLQFAFSQPHQPVLRLKAAAALEVDGSFWVSLVIAFL